MEGRLGWGLGRRGRGLLGGMGRGYRAEGDGGLLGGRGTISPPNWTGKHSQVRHVIMGVYVGKYLGLRTE